MIPPLPQRGGLRIRLVLWNVLALAGILALLGGVMQYSIRTSLLRSIDRDLRQRTPPLPPSVRFGDHGPRHDGEGDAPPDNPAGPPNDPPQDGPNAPPPADSTDDGSESEILPQRMRHPRMFDLLGRDFMGHTNQGFYDPAGFKIALGGGEDFTNVTIAGRPFRVFSRPLRDRGQVIGVGQNALPLGEYYRAIADVDGVLLTLIPMALLLAGIGGAVLTGRALRPVRQITQAAAVIGAEDLSRRLPVSGKDEFARLAATFNAMLSRLQHSFAEQQVLIEQQRRFTGDASHELRTPLTIIKANTSLLLPGQPSLEDCREALEDIDRAANAMTRLVQDLLLLTRSDGGQLGRNAVLMPVSDVLENAAQSVRKGEYAPVQIESESPHLTLRGNPDELTRLFANLLENAARYTPQDGQIRVTAAAQHSVIVIQVTDTGSGIAAEHLPHLCERFYRVDAARSRPDGGTGLGLAICKSIAEAHGGTLAIASEPGRGTTVTVTLPRPESISPLPLSGPA